MTLREKTKLIERAAAYMERAEFAKKLADGHHYDAHNSLSSIHFPNLQMGHLNNVERYEKLSAYCEKRAMQILKSI